MAALLSFNPIWLDLYAAQNNDVTYLLNMIDNGVPFNPTGFTLTLFLKASQTALDSSATTFTVANSGLVVVSAPLGQINWALPHANTATPGPQWWRLDAVDASNNRASLMMGNLTVLAV